MKHFKIVMQAYSMTFTSVVANYHYNY